MAELCLPKELSEAIRKNIPTSAVRSIALMDDQDKKSILDEIVGTFDIDDQYKELFRNELEDTVLLKGKEILESRISKKTKKSNATQMKMLSEKVQEIKNLGGFNQSKIEELTEIELGVALNGDQAEKLVKATENLAKYTDENGNVSEFTDEFGKVYKQYKDTLAEVAPSSFGKQLVSTGNANLLFGVKSAVTNVTSNSAFGVIASVDRSATFGKPFRFEQAFKQALNDANYYRKYSFDKTRADNVDNNIQSLGETMVQFGDRNVAEKYAARLNDIAYQKLLSTPDQFYASLAKTDTIYRMAKREILEEFPEVKVNSEQFNSLFDEVVNDAMQLKPTTERGVRLKDIGIAEANRVTFQEDSTFSKINIQVRKNVDELSVEIAKKIMPEELAESFKVGTFIVPFAQTPANVIKTGIDYSGLKLPFDVLKAIKTTTSARNSGAYDKGLKGALDALRDEGVSASFAKSVIGVTAAVGVAALIHEDNYIGAFPTSQRERELLKAKRASTNSVKIGNTWVSLDYLGPIGAPLIGVMELKKNWDKGMGEALLAYGIGSGRQLAQIPALQGVQDIMGMGQKIVQSDARENAQNMYQGLMSFITSRTIPTIVSDVGETIDPVERDTRNSSGFEPSIAEKIPVLRQNLDENTDVFGIAINNTGVGELLFGSRVQFGSKDSVIKELDNLANQGFNATPTDMLRSARTFKVPKESYNEEKNEIGQRLHEAYKKKIESSPYQKASADRKFEMLEDVEDREKKRFKKEMERKYGKLETE